MAEVGAPAFKAVARRPANQARRTSSIRPQPSRASTRYGPIAIAAVAPESRHPDPQPLFRDHPEGRWGRGSYCRSMANPNVALVYEVLADSVLVVPVHTVGRGAASVEDALEAARTLAGAA